MRYNPAATTSAWNRSTDVQTKRRPTFTPHFVSTDINIITTELYDGCHHVLAAKSSNKVVCVVDVSSVVPRHWWIFPSDLTVVWIGFVCWIGRACSLLYSAVTRSETASEPSRNLGHVVTRVFFISSHSCRSGSWRPVGCFELYLCVLWLWEAAGGFEQLEELLQ